MGNTVGCCLLFGTNSGNSTLQTNKCRATKLSSLIQSMKDEKDMNLQWSLIKNVFPMFSYRLKCTATLTLVEKKNLTFTGFAGTLGAV